MKFTLNKFTAFIGILYVLIMGSAFVNTLSNPQKTDTDFPEPKDTIFIKADMITTDDSLIISDEEWIDLHTMATMPHFPGCEDIGGSVEDKKQCADKKMLEFVYNNVAYPQTALEKDIEGIVVIRFTVDVKGNVIQPEIIRDIGGGCGKEAMRVVKLMNELPERWIPGRHKNKLVEVQYNLPVRFKLEG